MAIVKIKTWERMKSEFGLDKEGDVSCKSTYVLPMEVDLPPERIIEVVYDEARDIFLWFYDKDTLDYWEVSMDMIEEIIDDTPNNVEGF